MKALNLHGTSNGLDASQIGGEFWVCTVGLFSGLDRVIPQSARLMKMNPSRAWGWCFCAL